MRISDWSSDVCSSYLNGQRVAVLAVAELELALEVGAPQIVRCQPRRQGCAGGSMPGPADRLDQAVAVQHGVDRALGWHPHVAGQPPHQQLADLARAPVRLVPLEVDDQALDLRR